MPIFEPDWKGQPCSPWTLEPLGSPLAFELLTLPSIYGGKNFPHHNVWIQRQNVGDNKGCRQHGSQARHFRLLAWVHLCHSASGSMPFHTSSFFFNCSRELKCRESQWFHWPSRMWYLDILQGDSSWGLSGHLELLSHVLVHHLASWWLALTA